MSRSAELICVPPDKIPALWNTVSPFIYSAMANGDFGSFNELESKLLNGDALLWISWNGEEIMSAAVTELNLMETGGLVCTIVACGGMNMEKWLHLIDGIETFARHEGCKSTRIVGRKGWLRKLPDYRMTKVVIEKELH